MLSLSLYGLVVLALLIAELREDSRAQFFFKPLAAFGFVLLAVQFGALETVYGKYFLAGLLACALGDVLLLSRKSEKLFMGGMAAFALGHIIYSFGFMAYGLEFDAVRGGESLMGLTAMAVIGSLFGPAYIIPKALHDMRIPIIFYSVIIITMFALATLTNSRLILFAATCFAVSDFFVGIDRFINPKRYWALAITPLYFGAQALFALSTAI